MGGAYISEARNENYATIALTLSLEIYL